MNAPKTVPGKGLFSTIVTVINDNFRLLYQHLLLFYDNYIKQTKFVGYFPTLTELGTEVEEATSGCYAYIPDPQDDTKWIVCRWMENKWVATDERITAGNVSITNYNEGKSLDVLDSSNTDVDASIADEDRNNDILVPTTGWVFGPFITWMRSKFVRKDNKDGVEVIEGDVKIDKGLAVSSSITATNVTLTGNVKAANVEVSDNVTAKSVDASNVVQADALKSHTDGADISIGSGIVSDNFVTGLFDGKGWKVGHDGDAEMESLTIRQFLEVPEMRFNRASIIVGTNIQSPCAGIIKEVYPDKDEEGNELPTGYAVLELGDDDIAGSIAVGDLCWGYWHDMNNKSNNASVDSDDCKGNIQYGGFVTVYFHISQILNSNSTSFRYELRNDTNEDGLLKYNLHPFVGMHFGGRGSTTDASRQGFTMSTPNYTATYQLVSGWDWSDMAKYVVRVSGRLDGFEALANVTAGTWSNYFGTIDCNFYYRGNLNKVDVGNKYYLYITQSSNGMIEAGETENVSIVIRDGAFNNVTEAFTITVGDVDYVYGTGDFTDKYELKLSYPFASLVKEFTRIPVSAQLVTDRNTYTVIGSISIRRLSQETMNIITSCDNDPFIDNIEPKHISCSVVSSGGFDFTSQVSRWTIERESSNPDADAIWAQRTKVKDFSGEIDIYWSDDVTVNDLDLTTPTTKFKIKAVIGEDEVETKIEI